MDSLIDRILELRAPISIRLVSTIDTIPRVILDEELTNRWKTPIAMREAITRYNKMVIRIISDMVPSITIPWSLYAMYGYEGIAACMDTVEYAKSLGMLAIIDARVNATSEDIDAMIDPHIQGIDIDGVQQEIYHGDFITINPYSDSTYITKLIRDCEVSGKGAFITAKCSGEGIQDILVNVNEGNITNAPLYMKICGDINRNVDNSEGNNNFKIIGASLTFNHSAELDIIRRTYPKLFLFLTNYDNRLSDSLTGFTNGIGAIVDIGTRVMNSHKNISYEGMSIEEAIHSSTAEAIEYFRTTLNL